MLMKRVYCFFIAILLFLSSPLHAQNTTEGTEFWVTFGQVAGIVISPLTINSFDFHIRVVGGCDSTSGTIYFTNLGTSIPFEIAPYEIYGYSLDNTEKPAVYNTVPINAASDSITNFSIRVTTSNPVSVFAYRGVNQHSDISNVLPVTALETEYYAISYPSTAANDAYTVIATQNNTSLWHNEDLVAILDSGEVYYRTSLDITGNRITSSKPVAFFAQHKVTSIHNTTSTILFQQLAPVNTWGKAFFVPVTIIGREYVRILASENNTTISQIGGTIITGTGGQHTLENLQAGEFVELEISLSNNGCFIHANNPVGVCSFMESNGTTNPIGSASQAWIPAVEQTTPNVLMAPYVHNQFINYHCALIITSTATRGNTTVSIGGESPVSLSDGNWVNNAEAKMSFYNFPLTNLSSSYIFSNQAGIIVLGYGINAAAPPTSTSYYYLAGSSMRNMSATFTANDIPYYDMFGNMFCENDITFVADIEGIHPNPGSLKWYIDGDEYVQVRDSLQWSKNFATGSYEIKMEVRFEDNNMEIYEGTLKVGCEAAFYANNVHYDSLYKTTFCAKNVDFRAEIEGDLHADEGRVKWYINDVEYEEVRDSLEWSKNFETNDYDIKMVALLANGEAITLVATLRMEILWIKMRNIRTH